MLRVSVILTVKNEAECVSRLLDSFLEQSRRPDEIVCVDGGSTDETVDRLHAAAATLPLRVIVRPGANISAGRNAAIRAATGEIIAATDAGVRLDPCWLEELVRPFEMAMPGSVPEVVSGYFEPDPQSVFETALAATTLPARQDIRPDRFLPSSRSVAFRKDAWEKAGGYPEWLDYCEDLVLDMALRARGARFAFAPRAVVYFRPRSNLSAFFKQYYRYARGDGKANLWRRRHALRYATYLVALPAAVAALARGGRRPAAVTLAAGALIMFGTPYRRLVTLSRRLHYDGAQVMAAALWVPVLRMTGDIAKMLGYPVGVLWRFQHRSESPRIALLDSFPQEAAK